MLNPLSNKTKLSYQEYKRYARQIIIEEINFQGQQKLKKAKIICIGAGGLNSSSLLYLAASGVGTIGIIDHDVVEISNLQRQILYKTRDINKDKIKAAFNSIKELNPLIKINIYKKTIDTKNIKRILHYYDIVLDGTDNLKTRYIISQYCHKLHKIHVYGAINKFTGQISVFNYQNNTNYYNVYNKISYKTTKTCIDTGIINTITGLIGNLQTTETIKIITGIGSIISNYLLIFNLINCSLNKIQIQPYKINTKVFPKIYKNQHFNHKKYLYIKDIENNFDKKYKLIDIRQPIDFHIKHLKNAINIPLNKLKTEKSIKYIQTLKDFNIFIYCDSNTKSNIASQFLRKNKIDHYIIKNALTKK